MPSSKPDASLEKKRQSNYVSKKPWSSSQQLKMAVLKPWKNVKKLNNKGQRRNNRKKKNNLIKANPSQKRKKVRPAVEEASLTSSLAASSLNNQYLNKKIRSLLRWNRRKMESESESQVYTYHFKLYLVL